MNILGVANTVVSDVEILAYQKTPILLTGGIADILTPGIGMLPIIALTEGLNFIDQLTNPAKISLDTLFADWEAASGSDLFKSTITKRPLASQLVASSAQIALPKQVSMILKCPVHQERGYFLKSATLQSLIGTLEQHRALGGLFTVVTPAQTWTNLVLESVHDITRNPNYAPGSAFEFEFVKPLVQSGDILAVKQGNLMSNLGAKLVEVSSWGLPQTLVGG